MANAIESMDGAERASLVRFARSIGGAADPEDVAHEALLRAWSARRRFDPARPLGAWLRAIAANVVADLRRRARRLRFTSLEAGVVAATRLEAAAEREREEAHARLVSLLRAEIHALPAAEAGTFRLFYEQGLSVAAIAAREGVPAGTVKCRLHRARERLRSRLASGEVHP